MSISMCMSMWQRSVRTVICKLIPNMTFRQLSTVPVPLPVRNAVAWRFKAVTPSPTLVLAKKRNIPQSPLRMKFLVMLIRGCWVPDAVAQLKFSPKHRAVDVGKILNRSIAIAKLKYNVVAEELIVKEVMVTKGMTRKKVRIMGRGRSGVGKIRSSHVTIKVDKVNFQEKIQHARSIYERDVWTKRQALVNKLKKSGDTHTP